MSLLDTASLIVTPNAYKEGKLYSVIPSDGSGDLSVTRATTATRVNSAGLVELVPYNLLTYSERFENAAWTNVNSSEVANATTAPNGTLTADNLIPSATTAQHGTLQAVTLNALSQYTYSIYFKPNGYTAAILRLTGSAIWGPTDGIVVSFETATMATTLISGTPTTTFTSVGDGWYRCSVTATTIASGSSNAVVYAKEYSPYLGDGTSGLFIWGAQVNEGTLKDYFATETRLNISRIDYSLGGCPSLLVEPQRTNLLTWSEQFDNVVWVKSSVSVTANATTAPNGTLTADKLISSAVSGFHSIAFVVPSKSASTPYSFSFYAKAGEIGYCIPNLNNLFSGSQLSALINLTNGTASSISAGLSVNIVPFNDGWYRIVLTATSAANILGFSAVINTTNAAGSASFTGNGVDGIYLWGAQLEAGAYPTSYIPTTSASVTRNYDVPSLGNNYTSGRITAAGGTWFTHLINNTPKTRDSGGGIGLRLTNVAGNNMFHISTPSGSNQRYWIRKFVGGANTDLYNTLTNEVKIAIKWNGTTADIFVNGVKVVAATAFTSVDLENLNVNNGNIPYNINAMALWPTPLTDDELTALTTI
jgi:hypothetical protein